MPLVTLLTDFGTTDGTSGVMEGVIAARAPAARVVHLTHDIPAGDRRAAAFTLLTCAPWFPRGTVHVAVVDPGVGTSRKAVALRSNGSWFVGPDNGILSWAAPRPDRAVELVNPAFHLRPVSRTFHGRDVFAPAAAALSRGVPAARLGPALRAPVRLPFPASVAAGSAVRGEILAIDRFGNAVTNIAESAWRNRFGPRPVRAVAGRGRFPEAAAYGSVGIGAPVAVFGSAGFLELSVRDGSAAKRFGLAAGLRVTVRPASRS